MVEEMSVTEPAVDHQQSGREALDRGEEVWRVDELARRTDLPVRTIREYQTRGLLPPPERRGRVGLYGATHLRRLQLIGRLQDRGYSLAGIADLLDRWRDGADLAEVLGLHPDELVHVDEPGRPATIDQLASALPDLVPDHLDVLCDAGVVERCGPDRYCIPSPSLLQLTADAAAAGVETDRILSLLATIGAAADTVANETLDLLDHLPAQAAPDAITALTRRGRGLLAHGVGRLTIHTIGRRLGIDDDTDIAAALTDETRGGNSR